jgi:hypothetical protein
MFDWVQVNIGHQRTKVLVGINQYMLEFLGKHVGVDKYTVLQSKAVADKQFLEPVAYNILNLNNSFLEVF